MPYVRERSEIMRWVRNNKTGELYRSSREASKVLGISSRYIRNLASGSKKSSKYSLSYYEDGIEDPYEVEYRKEKTRHRGKRTWTRSVVETKCCECDNYKCSWLQKFEPVPGWDAVEVPKNQSYIVRECPEFIENKRRKK